MEDVFVGRMGGVHQGKERLGALTDWLLALRPPAPMTAADDDAAVRGKTLFQSEATGCTGCHTGAKYTNNKTVDVGTGGKLQVPSLVGVGYRAPLMHTGCAATLADRFNPNCGGKQHGHTDQLSTAEVSKTGGCSDPQPLLTRRSARGRVCRSLRRVAHGFLARSRSAIRIR